MSEQASRCMRDAAVQRALMLPLRVRCVMQIVQCYCTSIVTGKDVISRLRWVLGRGRGGAGRERVPVRRRVSAGREQAVVFG